MSSLLHIIYLTLLQFAAGFGLLTLFRINLKPVLFISLAVMLGVSVFSIIPFLLQLLYIPLTETVVSVSLIIVTVLLNIRFQKGIQQFKATIQNSRFKIRLYEIPFLLVIFFIVFVSVWRCFYFPPTPRDLTSGAEVIAEYAVREKTMLNSIFTVDLQTTNNPFKPPFITSLQIIYKYAGFPFGQIWLSTLFICLIVFLYHAICQTLHRLFAGVLLLFFLAVPEMYAYSFIALFDFPNAVFFFLSMYFLFEFFANRQRSYLGLAGLLMGIATYIRSETLVFACMMLPIIIWHHYKYQANMKKAFFSIFVFVTPSVAFYFLSVTLYINHYLPVKYDVEGLINTNLLNIQPLFSRFADMNLRLVLGKNGTNYYGYLLLIFLAYALVNLAWDSRKNLAQGNWLYAILIIYFGYPLLGYLLPLLDIDNSTKRGLFKIFPLILLYMSRSQLLIDLSDRLKEWELGKTSLKEEI